MKEENKTRLIMYADSLLVKFVYISPLVLFLFLIFGNNSYLRSIIHISGFTLAILWFVYDNIVEENNNQIRHL